MYTFEAGKGINEVKLNANFAELQTDANANETELNTISDTALLKDGSNVTQTMIDEFNKNTPNILETSGTISLTDNSVNFLTLTAAGTISLPTISSDSISHTIILVVAGTEDEFTLDLGTTSYFVQNSELDLTSPYSVMYIYNKIDSTWYYCLTQ